MCDRMTRRALLHTMCATPFAHNALASETEAFETPYKYGKLVVSGSGKQGQFDSKFADCPFVFSHDNRFYMAYIGFDGTG